MKTIPEILIVVDVQNDFVTGSLGTPEAKKILPYLSKRIVNFTGPLFLTQDTHGKNYLNTQEGKFLPIIHCQENTKGWEFPQEIVQAKVDKNVKVFMKHTFGSKQLIDHLVSINQTTPIEKISLMGICTDICVVSNALMIKAFLPEVPLYVESQGCAGLTVEKHQAALNVLQSNQIIVL